MQRKKKGPRIFSLERKIAGASGDHRVKSESAVILLYIRDF